MGIAAAHLDKGVRHCLICSRDSINCDYVDNRTYQEFFAAEAEKELLCYKLAMEKLMQRDTVISEKLALYGIDPKSEDCFKGKLEPVPSSYISEERQQRYFKFLEHILKLIENRLFIINQYSELYQCADSEEMKEYSETALVAEKKKLAVYNQILDKLLRMDFCKSEDLSSIEKDDTDIPYDFD